MDAPSGAASGHHYDSLSSWARVGKEQILQRKKQQNTPRIMNHF